MKKQILALMGILVIVFMMLTLSGCGSKAVTLSVPITWTDEEYFNGEDFDWYAGIVQGIYSYVTGLPGEPFEYKAVTPGTNAAVEFTFEVTTYDNYSVFVFMDANANGTYEADEDTFGAYTLATVGPGDVPTDLELTPYY